MRWVPLFLLLLLVGLPAFPPLIDFALRKGLEAAGFKGEWRTAGGYLLAGVELRGAKLEGAGLSLEAERVRVGYNLIRLFWRELPLRIQAADGVVRLKWDTVIPTQPAAPPSGPAPFELRIDELALQDVRAELGESRNFFLPTIRATVRGTGPYNVTAQLPEGRLEGTVERTGRQFEAWKIQAKGDVRAARYWFQGIEGGQLAGTWTIDSEGIRGENQIRGGVVTLPGPVPIREVYGPVSFDGNLVTANLVGRVFGGTAKGAGTVDIRAQEYRFRVEGNATLGALAKNWNLNLPIEGGGPVVVEGRGWQNLTLSGRYSGQGELLGEPLSYEGTLGFDKIFKLDTLVDGGLFDRTFNASVAVRNTRYTVGLLDSLGSRLRLSGEAADTTGSGTLTLPRPLEGQARVAFSSRGPRWEAQINSENVELPAALPFSLTGALRGDGASVSGRLGAVDLSGRWDDLQLRLSGLPMVVGQASGQATLKNGRFAGDFAYDSPYANFPVAVRQDGPVWRLNNRWAQGRFEQGIFTLDVAELPLQVVEPMRLSGRVRYEEGKLSGGWDLQGQQFVSARGELYDLASRFTGTLKTPLGNLPLGGTVDSADPTVLRSRLSTLDITYRAAEGLRIRGPLELGFIQGRSDLTLKDTRWSGQATAETPWLQARLEGRGSQLYATSTGYALMSGPVYPKTRLKGRLNLPLSGAVEVEAVPLELTLRGVSWPTGRAQFVGGLPFEGSLPVRILGQAGRLSAKGNLERATLRLTSPLASLSAEGPLRDLPITGTLNYAGYAGTFRGRADLFRAAYQGQLEVPGLEGAASFQGRAADLTYTGEFQQGRLRASGRYRYVAGDPLAGLQLRLEADRYDTTRWGLPAVLSGVWSQRGGRLQLKTKPGAPLQVSASLQGSALLEARALEVVSDYVTLRGSASLQNINLRGELEVPYLSGDLSVLGSPQRLQLSARGRYQLPYLAPAAWRFNADVNSQRWELTGPLALNGRGLRYSGVVSWPYSLQGREGILTGSLQGESLNLGGNLRTTYGGLPLSAAVIARGADLAKLEATLRLPEGQIRIAGKQARLDLETREIAKLFGADVRGRVRGELDLSQLPDLQALIEQGGQGRLEGALLVSGQEVELSYRDRVLEAVLPAYQVGLKADLGREVRLTGLKNLDGVLMVGRGLSGSMAYKAGGLELQTRWAGTPQRPSVQVAGQTAAGKLQGSLNYVLAEARGVGGVRLESPYASATLTLNTNGTRYQATGSLESLQYLKQRGEVRLGGEGTAWNLAWSAPMRLEARGRGAELERVGLSGRGLLEVAGRGFDLAGELDVVGDQFAGRMSARGEQVALELRGQDSLLNVGGTAFDAEVAATLSRAGRLGGSLRYSRDLAANRLRLVANLSGTLLRPELEGTGVVQGDGAVINLRYGFKEQLYARASGEGIRAELQGSVLELNLDADLKPFVGQALRLKTAGKGEWAGLSLPLQLTGVVAGQPVEASGEAAPARLEASLRGTVERQGFSAVYRQGLTVDLLGGYATGQVRLKNSLESLEGLVNLDLPLGSYGRLVGQADLAKGTVALQGQEGIGGSLAGQLREGWAQPTKWNLQSDLSAEFPGLSEPPRLAGAFELDAAPLAVRGSGRLELAPYGTLQLNAVGGAVEARGQGELRPLLARVQLAPTQATWSFRGELPRGLGRLDARGAYPGTWITGRYENLGKAFGLEGRETRLSVVGEGVQAVLTPQELQASLRGFTYGGVELTGSVAGAWSALAANLNWAAFERKGQLEATYTEGNLRGRLDGAVKGSLGWSSAQVWSGSLRIPEFETDLALSGQGTIPKVRLQNQYASGTLTYAGGRPEGVLNLDFPVASIGRLFGQADLTRGSVRLQGREGLSGTLNAQLREGWAQPTRWSLETTLMLRQTGLDEPARLSGKIELDASPLAVRGDARLELAQYGALGLRGGGGSVAVGGLGELRPLSAQVRLSPLQVGWTYSGPLPRNLGELVGRGSYPGTWLSGRYTNLGKTFAVEGRETQVKLSTPGLAATLTPQQLEARLEGFTYSGVEVSGDLKGAWSDLAANLSWEALGRSGQLEATYAGGAVWGRLGGAVSGEVGWSSSQTWTGRLQVPEYQTSLALSGRGGIPTVQVQSEYAKGNVTYAGGRPEGTLSLDIPISGLGRLVGSADLAQGQVSLEGRGGLGGTLQARLREGWAQPTRWELQSNLGAAVSGLDRPARLAGTLSLDAAPLAVRGEARLELGQYGSAQVFGQGAALEVRGQGELRPLAARVALSPVQVSWTYRGALPRNLGNLEGGGTYPGNWLTGRYQNFGQDLSLEGRETQVQVSGKGIQATLTPQSLEARLDDFSYSGVTVSGEVKGGWSDLAANLGWEYGERSGQVEATYLGGAVRAKLEGAVQGGMGFSARQEWSGNLSVPEFDATLALSGQGAIPRVQVQSPLARGSVTYANNRPEGLLNLDVPLGTLGRVVGTADLGQGALSLEGRGGLGGTLQARLREGWAQPTRWSLETDLRSSLGNQDLALRGQFEFDAAPLALRGSGRVSSPEWGSLRLQAGGNRVEVLGAEGLEALKGQVRLSPLQVQWAYSGALPRNLGSLEAGGTYPGVWAQGRFKYPGIGPELTLRGEDDRLLLRGQGLEADLTAGGVQARLNNLDISGVKLSGGLEGAYTDLRTDLNWGAFGRKGEIKGRFAGNRLSADLSGDLSGQLSYALSGQTWGGQVKFREGSLELSGQGQAIPQAEGEVLGFGLRLRYPVLEVAPDRAQLDAPRPISSRQGNLTIDVARRDASGIMGVRSVEVRGQGRTLEAVYPFAGGRLVVDLDLQNFNLRVSAPALGRGDLRYERGQLSGRLDLDAFNLQTVIEGGGSQARVSVRHPATDWLPWKGGSLTGGVRLDGSWSLSYRDDDEKQTVEADGRLLEGQIRAAGDWIKGRLAYGQASGLWAGDLSLDLPLAPITSRLSLNVQGGAALQAEGAVSGGLGNIALSARVERGRTDARARFNDLLIQEVPYLSERVAFLRGRASGEVQLDGTTLRFAASSPSLGVVGDSLALAARVSGALDGGVLKANLSLERPRAPELSPSPSVASNRTTATVQFKDGLFSGEASAASFPLHWLFSSWGGDVQGEAFWTGKLAFSYNTANPWASKGSFVGERMRFVGGGDELTGQSVLRYEGERFYIDQLSLSGKGTWRGGGYWGRKGSDLRLDLENTVFTPVLQVIPQLRAYSPEGSGTVRLTSTGQVFDLVAENFNFKLGPVRAETPRVRLRAADSVIAEGRLRLTAPYPAEAELSGEGNLQAFTVRARGTGNVPLLSPNEAFSASFSFPGYVLDASLDRQLGDQPTRLQGSLFPTLALSLTGPVPVAYPQYYLLDGLVDSNLTLRYQRGVYIISGAASVIRGRLGFPEGQREVTLPAPVTGTPNPAQANAVPVEYQNLLISAERGITIQESLAQGELAGQIFLNGDFANPFLSGEVVPLRGGFRLLNQEFTIRDKLPIGLAPEILARLQNRTRSAATFSPASGLLPEIVILADAKVLNRANNRQTDVYLALRGEFLRQNGRIKVNLEPILAAYGDGTELLSTEQIYALLVLGRSDASAIPAELAQTGLQAAVQSFIIGQIERELAKALGLDQVRVEIPALGGGGKVEETRFTFGRYISPELFLAGSIDLRGYTNFSAEYQPGDFRIRSSTIFAPNFLQELSLGYVFRPFGLDGDLTVNLSAGDLSSGLPEQGRRDGFRLSLGFNLRY
ncbi:MAG: translocation/assembly module TamB domain-containing protein [Meiothermus sp.]|nr:translocation/assembly module TamB domain-containing protein [Meiothermus sp.]